MYIYINFEYLNKFNYSNKKKWNYSKDQAAPPTFLTLQNRSYVITIS